MKNIYTGTLSRIWEWAFRLKGSEEAHRSFSLQVEQIYRDISAEANDPYGRIVVWPSQKHIYSSICTTVHSPGHKPLDPLHLQIFQEGTDASRTRRETRSLRCVLGSDPSETKDVPYVWTTHTLYIKDGFWVSKVKLMRKHVSRRWLPAGDPVGMLWCVISANSPDDFMVKLSSSYILFVYFKYCVLLHDFASLWGRVALWKNQVSHESSRSQAAAVVVQSRAAKKDSDSAAVPVNPVSTHQLMPCYSSLYILI